jgi:exosortase
MAYLAANRTAAGMNARRVAIAVLWLALLILCWPTLKTAVNLGLNDDRYFPIVAAPFLVVFLMYWERNRIFPVAAWSARLGAPLLAVAAFIYLFVQRQYSSHLALAMTAVILLTMAMFILCDGLPSFRAVCFPLACLLLMIPAPAWAMDKITAGLQHGSAAMSVAMLRLAGIPVFAQGMRISLKGVEIEVAPECSGIRSCLALALVGLLAGRVFLRYNWNRLALVVSTIPIAIFKNAIRISVIASLGAYVNQAFLHGRIHRYGGLVFTPLGMLLFLALLVGLQKSEKWLGRAPTQPPSKKLGAPPERDDPRGAPKSLASELTADTSTESSG